MTTFTKTSKSLLLSVNAKSARKHLLKHGYFNETKLFPSIISPSGLIGIKLKDIDWNSKNKLARTSPIVALANKGDKGARVYSLMHPFAYVHLVNELTNNVLWGDVISRLTVDTAVEVYTLPQLSEEGIQHDLQSWRHFNEIDYHNLSMGYEVELKVDIQNFYGTIYTHSIPWAILGKETAKSLLNDYSERSNRIDKILQNASDGQTNGIQTGNDVSNIIAELILKNIDVLLSPKIDHYGARALRYRDDYKIICKDRISAKHILEHLGEILNSHYGLSLNMTKTKITNINGSESELKAQHLSHQVTNDAFPLTDSTEMTGASIFKYLKIVSEASQYNPDRNFINNKLTSLLRAFSQSKANIKDLAPWAESITSLLVGLNNSYPINVSYSLALIDIVLHSYNDTQAKNELLDRILTIYRGSNNLLLNLWLYVLALKTDKDMAAQFLSTQDNEIFNMIKNNATKNIRFFKSRDNLSKEDMVALDKFSLIDIDAISEIENSKVTILEDFEPGVLDVWLNSHYG